MKYLRLIYLVFLLGVLGLGTAHAQEAPEMADRMRQEGKIYVVVAILGVILLGFILYLFLLDRKVTRLEKRLPAQKR